MAPLSWLKFLSSTSTSSSSDFLQDALEPPRSDSDLDSLNHALATLADVYPHHEVNLIREMLSDVSEESRVQIVSNSLCDTIGKEKRKTSRSREVEPWQLARSEGYKNAVRRVVETEFKLLRSSTRDSVLLENNYDYHRTKGTLTEKASKSLRVAFLALFSSSSPQILLSGNTELDLELTREQLTAQLDQDHTIALELNSAEYEEHGALFECECCFGDVTWEDTAFCCAGHYFCKSCLVRSIEEGMNGGSSTNLIDMNKGSIKCISAKGSSSDLHGCDISSVHLEHFLPHGTYQRLISAISKHNLDLYSQQESLLRCPFCSYAVLDVSYTFTFCTRKPIIKTHVFFFGLIMVSGYVPALLPIKLVLGLAFAWPIVWFSLFCVPSSAIFPASVTRALSNYARRNQRPKWSKMFNCHNTPECGRCSCLECGQEWLTGPGGEQHACDEGMGSEHAFVERRVDEAVKRVCPQCNTAFLKDGGCNKMACPCGYKMCYLCRADIREVGYNHFCGHFRVIPTMKCRECTKCLIYDDPNDDQLIKTVRRKAQREYWARLKRGQGVGMLDDEWTDEKGTFETEAAFAMDRGSVRDDHLQGFEAWLYDMILWIHEEV